MNRFAKIFSVLMTSVVLAASSSEAQTTTNTINAYISFSDLTGGRPVTSVGVIALCGTVDNGSDVVLPEINNGSPFSRAKYPSITNGNFTVSNLLVGVAYRFTFATAYTGYPVDYAIPVTATNNTVGSVPIRQWRSAGNLNRTNGGCPYYPAYVYIGGTNFITVNQTNVTVSTISTNTLANGTNTTVRTVNGTNYVDVPTLGVPLAPGTNTVVTTDAGGTNHVNVPVGAFEAPGSGADARAAIIATNAIQAQALSDTNAAVRLAIISSNSAALAVATNSFDAIGAAQNATNNPSLMRTNDAAPSTLYVAIVGAAPTNGQILAFNNTTNIYGSREFYATNPPVGGGGTNYLLDTTQLGVLTNGATVVVESAVTNGTTVTFTLAVTNVPAARVTGLGNAAFANTNTMSVKHSTNADYATAANFQSTTANVLVGLDASGNFTVTGLTPSMLAAPGLSISNTFSGVNAFTNPANQFTGTFTGDISGTTNYAATNLTGFGNFIQGYDIRNFGAYCDNAHDDTAALTNAIWKCYTNGGGTVLIPIGKTLIAGSVTIPNTATNNLADTQPYYSRQQPIRIHGYGDMRDGQRHNPVLGDSYGGSLLHLTYQGTYKNDAKIKTYGFGSLEIDGLTLWDDTGATNDFIFTTGTTINIHDNQIFSWQGAVKHQDAIVMGGTETYYTNSVNYTNAGFQGYDSKIINNVFNNFERCIVARTWFAHGIINENYFDTGCGSTNPYAAAIVFDGNGTVYGGGTSGPNGDSDICFNRFEFQNYKQCIYLNNSAYNTIIGNDIEDNGSAGYVSWTNDLYFAVCDSNSYANIFLLTELIQSPGISTNNHVLDLNGNNTIIDPVAGTTSKIAPHGSLLTGNLFGNVGASTNNNGTSMDQMLSTNGNGNGLTSLNGASLTGVPAIPNYMNVNSGNGYWGYGGSGSGFSHLTGAYISYPSGKAFSLGAIGAPQPDFVVDNGSGNVYVGNVENPYDLTISGTIYGLKSFILKTNGISPPSPNSPGLLFWADGTNVVVTIKNAAGVTTTNKLSMTSWP